MEVYNYIDGASNAKTGDGKMTTEKAEPRVDEPSVPPSSEPSIKTKVSVSIIGDAFADLLCYLDNGLPKIGGDVRVNKPSKYIFHGKQSVHPMHIFKRYFASCLNPIRH